MTIKFIGESNCRYWGNLNERAQSAFKKTGAEANVERIESFEEIYAHGILATPALSQIVINKIERQLTRRNPKSNCR